MADAGRVKARTGGRYFPVQCSLHHAQNQSRVKPEAWRFRSRLKSFRLPAFSFNGYPADSVDGVSMDIQLKGAGSR